MTLSHRIRHRNHRPECCSRHSERFEYGARHFVGCLLEEEEAVLTAEHARHVLDVILAAYASIDDGGCTWMTVRMSERSIPIPNAFVATTTASFTVDRDQIRDRDRTRLNRSRGRAPNLGERRALGPSRDRALTRRVREARSALIYSEDPDGRTQGSHDIPVA